MPLRVQESGGLGICGLEPMGFSVGSLGFDFSVEALCQSRKGGSLSVREFCGNTASDHTSGHANGPSTTGGHVVLLGLDFAGV